MTQDSDRLGKISIIVPVYNEEESVVKLYTEIKEVLKTITLDFEVIFINDGSKDNTQTILESLVQGSSGTLKIIQFRKNFGKADAYKAGFDLSTGEIIFTMDGDLQDNPNDIPNFLTKINEGFDVVVGWKQNRKDSISKIAQSRLFNFILQKITHLHLHDFDNGYRCIKKEVLNHLDLYEGLYRYIPVFANAKGFSVSEIPVNHRKRQFGKSKYGFSRLFKGFFDLITLVFISAYLKRPLHFFGLIGTILFLLGFGAATYLTFIKIFFAQAIGGRPLLILSIFLMIVGIQFVLFGLIGEMIANSSRKEKNYTIKKII